MIYSINADNYTPEEVQITGESFARYYSSYQCQERIINRYKMEFGNVEILESHGREYFKLRIPKDQRSLGFMYGFIESNIQDSWGVKEYSIS